MTHMNTNLNLSNSFTRMGLDQPRQVDSANSTKCYLKDAPSDVILKIFSNCSFQGIASLACTSKEFNDIQKDPFLWEQLAKRCNLKLDQNQGDYKKQVANQVRIMLEDGHIDFLAKEVIFKNPESAGSVVREAVKHLPEKSYIHCWKYFGHTILFRSKSEPGKVEMIEGPGGLLNPLGYAGDSNMIRYQEIVRNWTKFEANKDMIGIRI